MTTYTNQNKHTTSWDNSDVPSIVYLWGASYSPWLSTSYPWKKLNTYSEFLEGTKSGSSWTNIAKS